ncbi:MAG: hypothetical protein MUO60_09555 [Clostridiaceae bacterium]|nr:hypothetical protein [Clostridiaceae bacterium]
MSNRLEALRTCNFQEEIRRVKRNLHPIIMEGETREKEKISGGMVINTEDGSIDQLLSERLGAKIVVVLETYILPDNDPPLEERVKIHLEALNIFYSFKIFVYFIPVAFKSTYALIKAMALFHK